MGERTYKQLNWTSRIKLETMLKHGHSKKEIAEELGVHISTVYRELKRGTYEHLNSDYTTEERYSPEKAEARYQEGLSAKGAPLKIGKNHAAAQFIEDKIGNEDYSPAAVCALLKQEKYKHFGITFCRATIYKYVEDGVFLTLTNQDLPEKGDRKKKHKTIRKKQSRASSGTSIEQRPDYINERQEPGHWEMDTVVGKKRTKARLLVLSERVTRREIIIRIKDGRAETVVAALDRLERIYGAAFYEIFKTITVDNGSEFADADGIERSARRKDAKRTTVYYCHAYSSCERVTRREIIIRIKDGRAETVVAALDRLERIYGAAFYEIFKTITVDNGSEFADADGIERSARRKDAKRTTVYYCHAYSSCERGTNENINRMIRRQFPKGTDFDKVTAAEVKRVETWLNDYPREILGFMSSAEAFKIAFDRAA